MTCLGGLEPRFQRQQLIAIVLQGMAPIQCKALAGGLRTLAESTDLKVDKLMADYWLNLALHLEGDERALILGPQKKDQLSSLSPESLKTALRVIEGGKPEKT